MSKVIAVYLSRREAQEHARRLNENRNNNEVYGCRPTKDGRTEVIFVSIVATTEE